MWIKSYVDAVVDLIWPPGEGDPPVSFSNKLWTLFLFVAGIVFLVFIM